MTNEPNLMDLFLRDYEASKQSKESPIHIFISYADTIIKKNANEIIEYTSNKISERDQVQDDQDDQTFIESIMKKIKTMEKEYKNKDDDIAKFIQDMIDSYNQIFRLGIVNIAEEQQQPYVITLDRINARRNKLFNDTRWERKIYDDIVKRIYPSASREHQISKLAEKGKKMGEVIYSKMPDLKDLQLDHNKKHESLQPVLDLIDDMFDARNKATEIAVITIRDYLMKYLEKRNPMTNSSKRAESRKAAAPLAPYSIRILQAGGKQSRRAKQSRGTKQSRGATKKKK
jgi:hypothetical protein